MKSSLVLLAGLVAMGHAVGRSDFYVLHEKRDLAYSSSWNKRRPADGAQKIPVSIALKETNLDKGMDYILQISDPKSSRYGHQYEAGQVAELFAPSKETIDTVRAWLVKSGIPQNKIVLSKTKGWLRFDTTVNTLQSLLKTDYHVYEHSQSSHEHIGTDEYSLPLEVSRFVDFVLPGTTFTKNSKRAEKHKVLPSPPSSTEDEASFKALISGTANCDKYITPQCIKAMYKIPDATLSDKRNHLGIFEALDETYAQEDLDAFYNLTGLNIPAGTGPKLALINGATAPTSPDQAGSEPDLDLEMAIPIIYPQRTTLFQVKTEQSPLLAFLDAIDEEFCSEDPYKVPHEMCNSFAPTNIISMSYSGPEYIFSPKVAKRVCNTFMKFGLRRISVFVSSGDRGVAPRIGSCLGSNHDIFVPSFPASCPFVTTVGATTLPSGSKVTDREIATTLFSSGGGFSNVFDRPPWQVNAVGSYLRQYSHYSSYNTTDGVIPDHAGLFNCNGRGYPDIAAVGDNAIVVWRENVVFESGTSMSTPIVAAMFNRINEERLKLNKSLVGFINPALYQAADLKRAIVSDVIEGDQRLGSPANKSAPSACGNNGFSAAPRWDPVTGWGTPRYPEMLKYFLNL